MTATPDDATPQAAPKIEGEDRRAAGAVIGGHILPHMYLQGFYVILPQIYTSLGLTPVTAGLVEMLRRAGGGVASVGGGLYVDRFPRHRVPLLYISVLIIGLSYLTVGIAPTVPTLLLAIFVAGAAHSLWHPAAMGLLSEQFPARRGFMIATHRSSGSVGDVIGPLIVGALLIMVSWQTVLIGAIPVALLFAVAIWGLMRTAHGWSGAASTHDDSRSLANQLRTLRAVLKKPGLTTLLIIAVLTGLSQGGIIMWLGLYLSEAIGMGSFGIGVHVALLTGFGIIVGPYIGSLSDRIGRRTIITVVLGLKSLFALLMAITGQGILFSISVALAGAVLFGASSLIQAAALDAADGQQLEGSMLGLLWGLNAMTHGISPVIVGALIAALGYGMIFWYMAVVSGCAMLFSLLGPKSPTFAAQT